MPEYVKSIFAKKKFETPACLKTVMLIQIIQQRRRRQLFALNELGKY